jgi:segregation and condensation protein A
LEYQAFKEAALSLDSRLMLGRDTYKREAPPENVGEEDEEELVELNIFDLVLAFQRIVVNLRQDEIMEIDVEKMTIAERINEIMERLGTEKDMSFTDLFGETPTRKRIIYTFLAILELMKLRLIRAFQSGSFGPIRIFLAADD